RLRRLFWHWRVLAVALARPSAGNRSPARIAMMAMTTSSSISVNACRRFWREGDLCRQRATGILPAVLFSDFSAGKMPAAPWGSWLEVRRRDRKTGGLLEGRLDL